jgi:SAM-dependent methyltransferase
VKTIKVNNNLHYKLNIQNSRKEVSKVSAYDIEKYFNIIKYRRNNINVICLASRTGREIDLFRLFFQNKFLFFLIKIFEKKGYGFNSFPFNFLLKQNLTDISKDNNSRSIFMGIELNKERKRKDTLNISFDQIPDKYNNKFDICFFNSLDHSKSPIITAKNINKIVKKNGYIILTFPSDQKSHTLDPTSNLKEKDVKKLFGKNIIYKKKMGVDGNMMNILLKNKFFLKYFTGYFFEVKEFPCFT